MSILSLSHFPSISQIVFSATSQLKKIPPAWVLCAGALLEAGIREAQNINPRLGKYLPERLKKRARSGLINHIHQVSYISNLVSMGMLLFVSKQLADTVFQKYGISIFPSFEGLNRCGRREVLHLSASVLLLTAFTVSTVVGVKQFNRRFYPSKDFKAELLATLKQQLQGHQRDLQRLRQEFQDMQQRREKPTNDWAVDYLKIEQSARLIEKDINHPNNLSITWDRPFSQQLAQYLLVTRMTISLAHAYFSSHRVSLFIDVAAQGLSLAKLAQLNWLNFARKSQWASLPTDQVRIKETEIAYRNLMLPYCTDANQVEKCTICQDDEPNLNVYFCANHGLHDSCLVGNIYTFSQQFEGTNVYTRHETRNYRNGAYTGTTYAYEVQMKESLLPFCSACKERPSQHYFDVKVHDADHGRYTAAVKIISNKTPAPSQIFEKLDLIYSLFQVGMLCLQRYPELTLPILKMQKALTVVDAAMALGIYVKLYQALKGKYKGHERKLRIATIPALLALGAISWLALSHIQHYLKPATDLKKVLETLALSPAELQKISVAWEAPFFQKIIQWIHLNRIVGNLATALFSGRPFLNITNAAIQTFGLYQLCTLPWIKFDATSSFPLEKVAFNVMNDTVRNREVYQRNLQELTTTFHYLVKDPSQLQSDMQTMLDVNKNMLNQSSWSRYMKITADQYGRETSRQLYYDVRLHKDALARVSGEQMPFLEDLAMRARDAYYGKANVDIIR